jgi:alkanesulfonate monooxygenase SsuD/methylene tetrahydromethanopterin reductase-like flavin-dependent oxidoreductase (luciferase family)
MMRLVARYADAWNTAWHLRPADVLAAKPKLDEACAAVGRDPATIALTAGSFARFVSPDEQPQQGQRDRPDATTITGSPEQMAQALHAFESAGVTHLVLNIEPCELRSVERLGPVIALLRAS